MARAFEVEEVITFIYNLEAKDVFCGDLIYAEEHRREQLYIAIRRSMEEVCTNYWGANWNLNLRCSSVPIRENIEKRSIILRIEVLDDRKIITNGKLFYNAGYIKLELIKWC